MTSERAPSSSSGPPPELPLDPTDAELVDRIRSGRARRSTDTAALEVLVDRYKGLVVANCRFLVGQGPDAEDLAQEVFLKAYTGIGELRDGARFKGWLKRIKVNHCLDHLRRPASRPHLDVDDPAMAEAEQLQTAPQVVTDLDQRARAQVVRETLENMDPRYRIPLVMADVDGWTYAEIGEALGLGPSAVKMRVRRARQEFRARYQRAAASRPAAAAARVG